MKYMKQARRRIPVCEPTLDEKEAEYVNDAVRSSWISSRGSYLDRFEREFPGYVGAEYGVATCNGTVALHLALRALGIGPGDEVIVPTFTMIASVFAICYVGATPVLVDCDPLDWNLKVDQLSQAYSERTKAIMAVHIYGHPSDMDPILAFAKTHGLFVIEDAAEAHGAEYKSKRCGSIGDVGCFSFFANKNITCGEGGMVVTSDISISEKLRYFKNLCFPLGNSRIYEHSDIGYNYRMSNLHAAIGCAQLEKIDVLVNARRRNAQQYSQRLVDIPGLQLPIERPWARNVYWMYGLVCSEDSGIEREYLIRKLDESGIETRRFFTPMHKQEALLKYGIRMVDALQESERLGERGLYLPSSSSLSYEDIEYVTDTIESIFRGHS